MTNFVRREGARLMLDDAEFRIAGANNYYAAFVEERVARAIFALAASARLNTMRIWAFREQSPSSNVFFQSWAKGCAEYDHEALCGLDRAIAIAEEHGIRLILTLTNNWKDFGGIPAYLRWFGLSSHDMFFRDGRCRAAYWLWVQQLLNRTNTVSGKLYKEDPTILAWELGNELRCPEARDGRDLLIAWYWEMATLLKANAPNQLVAAGDEGFFRRSGAGRNSFFNGVHGVDFEAILGIGPIDFGTYHMYGEWAKADGIEEFGQMWIREHIDAAARAGKPVLLEEYGVRLDAPNVGDAHVRARIYRSWLQTLEASGALGDMVWMIGLPSGPGQPYTPDGYVVQPGPELDAIREHAEIICAAVQS